MIGGKLRMRKILTVVLTCISVLMLVGCGGKEQSVTLTTEQMGVKVAMTLDAKGDKVTKISQTNTVPIENLTEEQKTAIDDAIEQAASSYEGYEGVTYSHEITDTEVKEIIAIDMTQKDAVEELSKQGLLPIEGSSSNISLEKTQENLIGQGWEVVE